MQWLCVALFIHTCVFSDVILVHVVQQQSLAAYAERGCQAAQLPATLAGSSSGSGCIKGWWGHCPGCVAGCAAWMVDLLGWRVWNVFNKGRFLALNMCLFMPLARDVLSYFYVCWGHALACAHSKVCVTQLVKSKTLNASDVSIGRRLRWV